MGRTIRWMLAILLLGSGAAGYGISSLYYRSDEMLKAESLRQFQRLLPGSDVTMDAARFDWSGRIRLFNVRIVLPGQTEPILTVPELIVKLNREELADHQMIVVEQLRAIHPNLHLVRRTDGRWNAQDLTFAPNKGSVLPDVVVERGSVGVELDRPEQPALELLGERIEWSCTPVSARQYSMQGHAEIQRFGTCTIDRLMLDLDQKSWSVRGAWPGFPVNHDLVTLGQTFIPGLEDTLQQQIQHLAEKLKAVPHDAPASMQARLISESRRLQALPQFQFTTNLQLEASSDGPGSPLKPRVRCDVQTGTFNHQLLPFALTHFRGTIYADEQGLIVKNMQADHGSATLTANGRLPVLSDPSLEARFHFQLSDTELTDKITNRLPGSLQKIIRELQLTGVFDGEFDLIRSSAGAWKPVGKLTGHNCSFAHEKFPYPVTQGTGTLDLKEGRIDVNVTGRAGTLPVVIRGLILNPGPAGDAAFNIRADNVAIDELLKASCPPSVERTITDLNLQGQVDVAIQIAKPAGLGQKVDIQMAARIHDANMKLAKFPYRIDDVSGKLLWKDNVLTVKKIEGRHDTAKITGDAEFDRNKEDLLDIRLHIEEALFDRQLREALDPTRQIIWDELNPRGRFTADVSVEWRPEQSPLVNIHRMNILGCDITLRQLPYPIHDVRGELQLVNGELTILHLAGRHDDTVVRVKGKGECLAVPWSLSFDEFYVDDLVANASFRKALPTDVRLACETLNPAGPFSVHGKFNIQGPSHPAGMPGLAWDLDIILPDNQLTAGLRFDKVHGAIKNCRGRTQDSLTEMAGTLELDLVRTNGHQVGEVRGPFVLKDKILIVGSREVAEPTQAGTPPRLVPREDQLSGKAIDGDLFLNAIVRMDQPVMNWHLKSALNRASLERYAQLYLRGQPGLRGEMNGWMELQGRGNDASLIIGTGQLKISPAALYELPIMMQIFNSLQLAGQDSRPAFNYADLNFTVADSRYNFSSIDLVGQAISLRGRGYVRFDGGIMLDFYSRLARNQVPIPVIHELVGALSRDWVGVEVRGNIGSPVARVKAVPKLDGALKQFLGSFEPRIPAGPPPTFR